MKSVFFCRYRDPFGRWRLIPLLAVDADEAREKCSQRHGHCEHAWAAS